MCSTTARPRPIGIGLLGANLHETAASKNLRRPNVVLRSAGEQRPGRFHPQELFQRGRGKPFCRVIFDEMRGYWQQQDDDTIGHRALEPRMAKYIMSATMTTSSGRTPVHSDRCRSTVGWAGPRWRLGVGHQGKSRKIDRSCEIGMSVLMGNWSRSLTACRR